MLKAHKGKAKAHQCIIIALKIIQKKHPMEKSSISFGALMKAPLSGTIKFPKFTFLRDKITPKRRDNKHTYRNT